MFAVPWYSHCHVSSKSSRFDKWWKINRDLRMPIMSLEHFLDVWAWEDIPSYLIRMEKKQAPITFPKFKTSYVKVLGFILYCILEGQRWSLDDLTMIEGAYLDPAELRGWWHDRVRTSCMCSAGISVSRIWHSLSLGCWGASCTVLRNMLFLIASPSWKRAVARDERGKGSNPLLWATCGNQMQFNKCPLHTARSAEVNAKMAFNMHYTANDLGISFLLVSIIGGFGIDIQLNCFCHV